MAILGVITDLGLSTAQDAANNEGFNLVPVSFGVSETAGTLDPARTTPNAGLFYSAAISSRVIIDQNTIKFVLTVPPNQIPAGTFKIIREVYLNVNDSGGTPFLFAIGQPTDEIRYNSDDQVTLELEMALTNLDLTANFIFNFTQATEISEHNTDPNAHIEMITALRKAGIFIPAGTFPFERRGQHFEQNAEFDGAKSSILYNGVTFTATYNGTEANGQQLVFDGSLTVDEVRAVYNAANFPFTVEHDGTGTEVLPAGNATLVGGTYVVQDKDLVYKDTDGIYKQAIADGTIRSRVVGVALRDDQCVSTHGLHDINTGFATATPLFLSGTTPGAFVDFDTNVSIGISLGDFVYFSGFPGDVSANVSQDFDAVVTNAAGVGQFLTTQEAIDFVPNDGRILINKLEDVAATINTNGKNVTLVVNGPENGWRKFDGLSSSFQVNFDQVPTQGTFRIEWDSQESVDLLFNATALDVQNEFNLFNGHNGFTVTGDFANGFVFTSNDLNTYPLPTFSFAGLNEIQRFDFSNVPDDGTVTFEHDGNPTLNFPWDDNAADLQIALEALSSINAGGVNVTGDFATGFQIEYIGGFLVEGVQEQPVLQVIQNDLDLGGVSTDINGTTILPILATIVQKGKKPASNLFNGTVPINITVQQSQAGLQPGPDRAMIIDAPQVSIRGLGKFENFAEGIVFDTAADNIVVEAYFPNTTCPILTKDKLPGTDYDIEALGYAKDILSQLRIVEHPTNPKRVKITGAEQILASGITLTQDLNGLLMKFEGAEIDFENDPVVIYEADGVTPLGIDIDRPTPAAAMWRWVSVNLVAASQEADQSLKAQVLLLPAEVDGATQEAAQKPPFGDKPIGMVALEGALGDQEITEVVTRRNNFGDLAGKAMTLYHPLESVAFWFSDPSLDSFSVEAGTNVTGSNQDLFNAVTQKVMAAKITVGSPIVTDSVDLYIQKNGSPTGSIAVRLLGDNAGQPDLGNVIATGAATVDMNDVPTNFVSPVRVEFTAEVNLAAGDYYLEIDGDLLVLSGGNFLGWNSEDNGVAVEIFNRDPSTSTWLSDLGNRTAHFDLLDKTRGIPAIAALADREVEIDTLGDEDLQSVVATKLHAAINADVRFSATVSTNRIIVTNAELGAVADTDVGDTGFFANVQQQGTDTDLSGIEDITNKAIRQLGGSSGSGGGAGDTFDALKRFEAYLRCSEFRMASGNSFKDRDTPLALIDEANSTGAYSIPNRNFVIGVGQTMRTQQLIDFTAFSDDLDVSRIAARLYWENFDPNAIVRASRMGFQAGTVQEMSVERIANTDTMISALEFEEEKNFTNFQSQPVSDLADVALDDGSSVDSFIQPFTLAQVRDISSFNLYLIRTGDVAGKFNISLVQDDGGGNPDFSAIITQRGSFFASDIGETETIVSLELDEELAAGVTYHLVIDTDDEYKADFSAGVRQIAVRNGADNTLNDYQTYDGTAFTIASGDGTAKYDIFEQELILDTLEENPLANETGSGDLEFDDATVQQLFTQPVVIAQNRTTWKELTIRLEKLGAPAGNLIFDLYRDNGSGAPDTSSSLHSQIFAVADLSVGNNDLELDLGHLALSAGTYYWSLRSDSQYQTSHNAGVDAVTVVTDDSGPSEAGILEAQISADGVTWNAVANTAAVFLLRGRDIQLIIEVESALLDATIQAWGVAYDRKIGEVRNQSLPVDYFRVNGQVGQFSFPCSFTPDPVFTKVIIGGDEDGQIFLHGAWYIEGKNVVFEDSSFLLTGEDEIFDVRIDNLDKLGNTFIDDNPRVINLLKENFMVGSGQSSLDFGRRGRAVKSLADDGAVVEVQVTEDFGLGRGIRIAEV